jgi:hypothetical protein
MRHVLIALGIDELLVAGRYAHELLQCFFNPSLIIHIASGSYFLITLRCLPVIILLYLKCMGSEVFQILDFFLILEYLHMHNEILWVSQGWDKS